MLDFWQFIYIYRLFSLRDSISSPDIFPIILQNEDRNAQRKNLLELYSIGASNLQVTFYCHQLAHEISVRFSIDLTEKTQSIYDIFSFIFSGQIIIKDKNKAILETKARRSN